MLNSLPEIGKLLKKEHIDFLKTFSKSCRRSILEMVVNAQSGHPGGSLSCIDYLSLIYCFIISQTGEKAVISNGHISPGVYSTLAELGYIGKKEAIEGFRKIGKIYEGHITRHVTGVEYGTGPLGIGVSVASAFAHEEKLRNSGRKVFALAGDGECQEGQVHEMIHFAQTHKLNNLVLFIDYNEIQLTAGLKEISSIDIPEIFKAGHWKVIETDGHDYQKLWSALAEAYNSDMPIAIIGHTIMGKGCRFMEPAGEKHQADWHGKAPKKEEIEEDLQNLTLDNNEEKILETFRKKFIKWKPEPAGYPKLLSPVKVNIGKPRITNAGELTDCRTAYGKALLDLAEKNPQIIALTADLSGSVMTKFISEKLPKQYVEVGIAEQHMVSAAGGYSFMDRIPFASTFGAFMTSRAKDQARVNDINYTNVKMVATHCGLSVGEDGPTHQAIDDMGSMLGLLNTMVIEPADPNQTDHIIRYIASHYGNFYVRMGRHKFPIITKENGTPFFDENYEYEYGKTDIIREGKDVTIAATGACINEALKAREKLNDKISIEVVAVSSIKKFDAAILNSVKKTKKLITVEDHNTYSGLGSQLARLLQKEKIMLEKFQMIGVEKYQLSGKAEELYHSAGIDADAIEKIILSL
ncbi:transketolase [Candidatus Peregrinibacteria bacterium]|nr:transketolase [Candidatus Peregrinibacteria bacterium]